MATAFTWSKTYSSRFVGHTLWRWWQVWPGQFGASVHLQPGVSWLVISHVWSWHVTAGADLAGGGAAGGQWDALLLGARVPHLAGVSSIVTCHVMSRNVTLCHVMSRYVTLCHAVSRQVRAAREGGWEPGSAAAARAGAAAAGDLPPPTPLHSGEHQGGDRCTWE